MRIIGIDPGSLVTGYGIVDAEKGRVAFVACGCVRNKPSLALPERFLAISRRLGEVFDAYRPGRMAIEEVFFCKNASSALTLGEARGIAMLVAAERGVEVFEYAPRRVKKAVLGGGGAGKGQVQYMVKSLLDLDEEPTPPDASDALAIALCCAFTGGGVEARISQRASRSGEGVRPARRRVRG